MRPPSTAQTCANALLATGGLFTAVFLFFCWTARFRTFYKDDWDWVAPLLTGVHLTDYVFAPSNEHVVIIPRLLMWIDYQLTGGPGQLLWVIGLTSFLLVAATLLKHQSSQVTLSAHVSRSLRGSTLVLLFFTYQLQVFLSPAGITIPLVIAIAVGAMGTMIEATRRWDRGDRGTSWFLMAVVLCGSAALSTGQGLAVPFSLLVIVLTRRARGTAPVAALWIAVLLLTAYLYVRISGAHLPSTGAAALVHQLLFGLALFAGPVAFGSGSLGVAIGSVVLMAGLRELLFAVRRGKSVSDSELLCVGVAIFVLGTAGLTAMARAGLGLAQASQSRYALFTMLYLSVTLTLWTIRTSRDRSAERRQVAVLAVFWVCAMLLLPVDLFIGGVWWAKVDNARAAALALQVHVPDFDWIRTLHPNPQIPYTLSGLKTLNRLDDFRFTDRDRGANASAGTICRGTLRLSPGNAGGFFRMSGQVDVSRQAMIVVLDGAGTVQGLAGPAPIVAVPDPSYAQVIAAAWRTVRSGGRSDPAWFGFVRPGSGPPYRGVAVVDAVSVCSTSVDLE